MIASLGLILLCQLVGEVASRGLHLSVPGPVLGLVLLFLVLMARPYLGRATPGFLASGQVEATGRGLLAHLSLLFIPAGVGVIRHVDVFAAHGVALVTALIVSTILSLIVSVLVFRAVSRLIDAG